MICNDHSISPETGGGTFSVSKVILKEHATARLKVSLRMSSKQVKRINKYQV